MLPCSAKIYEGSEDYLFISYSHRDKELVFPILEALSEKGYRLWYDEGIDPGTEWPETIATHLEKAAVCLAFVSSNSAQSNNCRREINFALSKNLGFLSVILEDIKLSPGLEMQLSAYQSIHYFTSPDFEHFKKKLFGTALLDSCRADGVPEAKTKPAPAADKTDAGKEPEDGGKKKKKPGKGKLALILALVALIVAGAVCAPFLFKKGGKNKGFDDPVHVKLTADESWSEEETAAAVSELEARLTLLAGEGGYTLTPSEQTPGEYQLVMPRAVLHDNGIMDVLRCYLTRPINLFAADAERVETARDGYYTSEALKSVAIDRTDIKSLEQKTGVVKGFNAGEKGIENAENGYPYLEMTLDDSVIKQIDKLGVEVVIAFDVDVSNAWYYLDTVRDENNVFYLVDKDTAFSDLLYHNLTSEPLPGAFGVLPDPLDDVIWETEGAAEFGTQQRNAEQLAQEQTATYFLIGSSDTSDGELVDDAKELKARLDLLGEPYAFGKMTDDKYPIFAVRTAASRSDPVLMRLVGTKYDSYLKLRAGYLESPSAYKGATDMFSADETAGTVTIRDTTEHLNNLAAETKEDGKAVITLCVDGTPLLQTTGAELKKTISQGELRLLTFAGSGTDIGNRAAGLAALMNRVVKDNQLHYKFECDTGLVRHNSIYLTHVFDPDANGNAADDSALLCNTTNTDKLAITSGADTTLADVKAGTLTANAGGSIATKNVTVELVPIKEFTRTRRRTRTLPQTSATV